MVDMNSEANITEEKSVTEVNVSNTKKLSFFDKFTRGLAILTLIWFAYFVITDVIPEKQAKNELYSVIYTRAVQEVKSHWGGDSLYVEKYKMDNVVYHTTKYIDLGYGELPYEVYYVKVPIEFDDWGQHFEQEEIITVYCCRVTQWEDEGVVYSVEPHLFVADMFTGILEE